MDLSHLKTVYSGEIRLNEPLKLHTTFNVGGEADALFLPKTQDQLSCLLKALDKLPYVVIGCGSNLLVSDQGYRGAVIKLNDNFSGITLSEDTATALAGTPLCTLVRRSHEYGLTGAEALGGIPGSVGGAVVMNAGAYGSEIADFLVSVTVMDRNGKLLVKQADELALSYRSSNILKNGCTVVSAVFKFERGDVEQAQARLKELNRRRREKQPLNQFSAGSTFKRPMGCFAGKLIEDAGLKGCSIGGAQVSPKHAGFIVNTGDATSAQIFELITYVQNTVKDKFGIVLETEVKMIGY